MNKYFLGIIIIIVILILAATFSSQNKKPPTVTIKNKILTAELARTPEQQTKGLSGRDNLDANSGMLFVFDKSDIHTFWMKDTKIPLDIIWINDGQIVEIATLDPAGQSPLGGAASHNEKIPQYQPTQKANYVLEINAGLADEYGFQVGDEVEIKF